MNPPLETTAIAFRLHCLIQTTLSPLFARDLPIFTLRLLDKTVAFSYSCAIARQVAASLYTSPETVACQMAETLSERSEFEVVLKPEGWLEFDLRDRTVIQWLQARTQNPLAPHPGWLSLHPPSLDAERQFLGQYAHARCCSLLRAGDRISPSSPLPWEWVLAHSLERRLVYCILEVHDLLSFPPGKQSERLALKLLQNLSQETLSFERACLIWGLVKTENLELARLRLELLSLAQSLLQTLLTPILGIFAPFSL
ncbi:MAG: hypothetical protein F6K32_03790 [Desertifilum sp. SIO1I2]|nr:hypothetical protein [Desertifilum sp. SIO1I2]